MTRYDPLDFNTAISHLCSTEWAPSGTHVATHQSDLVLRALLPSSRTEQGRVAVGAAPSAIENIACVLRDPLVFYEPLGQNAIRLLRNLCARSPANQKRAAQYHAHQLVIDYIEKRFDFGDGDGGDAPADSDLVKGGEGSEGDQRMKLPFFGFAVEFLVNFVTCNPPNAEIVWNKLYPHVLSKLLNCHNHAAATATAALVHNCIAVVPHRITDIVNIWTGKNGTTQSITHNIIQQIREENEENDENFSWSFMIIRRLVAASMLQASFEALGSSLADVIRPTNSFSNDQVTLMNILDASASKSAETEQDSPLNLEFTDETFSFLSDLLEAALFIKNGDMLKLVGSIIGSAILLSEDSTALHDLRLRAAKSAVNVLQAVAASEHEKSKESESSDETKIIIANDTPLSGLKGVMVRLIALCCDLCKPAQDSVRKLKGLPYVLNATSYEKDTSVNPYLREWAVFAIRNLTLGNPENAKEISTYELVGVQNDKEFLEKSGMEAFMDSKTGRPRLRMKR